MAKEPDLDDALCWLEQAEAIIEYIADALGQHEQLGSAISLSLFGASSLLDRVRETLVADNQRPRAVRAVPQRGQ